MQLLKKKMNKSSIFHNEPMSETYIFPAATEKSPTNKIG